MSARDHGSGPASIERWPGLIGARPAAETLVSRAVWGKAPQARSDFRWLAASPGFVSEGAERALRLGIEDQAKSFYSVRASGDYILAAFAYPSKVFDATGRRGGLEKQILVARQQEGVSPLWLVFLLLERLVGATSQIWWARRDEVNWDRSESCLQLADEPPLRLETDELERLVQQGLNELRGLDGGEKTLEALYGDLAVNETGWVRNQSQPLTALATAVLLLPLDAQLRSVSAAGWIPSSRFRREDSEGWDILVEPAALRLAPSRDGVDESSRRRAKAVWSGQPGQEGPAHVGQVEPDPLVSLTAWDPEIEVSDSLSAEPFLDPGESPAFTPPLRGRRVVNLRPPGDSASSFIAEVYDFARSVERRWISADLLSARLGHGLDVSRLNSEEKGLLVEWARAYGSGPVPEKVDTEQWRLKGDLLAALAIAVAPNDKTEALGGRRWDKVKPTDFVGLHQS